MRQTWITPGRGWRLGPATLVLPCMGLLAAGCVTGSHPPSMGGLYDRAAQHHGPERNPIVVIPGLSGSNLEDDASGLRTSALLDERSGSSWLLRVRSPIPWSEGLFLFTDHLGLTRDPVFTDNLPFWLLEDARGPSSPQAGPAARSGRSR